MVSLCFDYLFSKSIEVPQEQVEYWVQEYGYQFQASHRFWEDYPGVYKSRNGTYRLKMRPSTLLTDGGSEFISKYTARICKKYNVLQQTSFPFRPLGVIERYNGTVKRKLAAVDWDVSLLNDIVDNYNHDTVHSTTRFTPAEVHFALITGSRGQLVIASVYDRLVKIYKKTLPMEQTPLERGTVVTLKGRGDTLYFINQVLTEDLIHAGHAITRYVLRNYTTGQILALSKNNKLYPAKLYRHEVAVNSNRAII